MGRRFKYTDMIEWLVEAQCRMHEGHVVVVVTDNIHRVFQWRDRLTGEIGYIALSDVKATPHHKQHLIPEWFTDRNLRASHFHKLADMGLTSA